MPAQTRQGNIKHLIPPVSQQDFAEVSAGGRSGSQSIRLALAVMYVPLSRDSRGRLYIELSRLSAPRGEER